MVFEGPPGVTPLAALHTHAQTPVGCTRRGFRFVASHRLQADALEIEAGAQRRLADEYDGAQQLQKRWTYQATDCGSRAVRDAEKNDPGVVRRRYQLSAEFGETAQSLEILPRPFFPCVFVNRFWFAVSILRLRFSQTYLPGT
jgi:hypothetical protein